MYSMHFKKLLQSTTCILKNRKKNYCQSEAIQFNIPEFFAKISIAAEHTSSKVTIVGAGNTGSACAITLLLEEISDNVVLVDTNENRLLGEVYDIKHGLKFLPYSRITASTDYKETYGSKVCVIAAGATRKPDQARLSLTQDNTKIFQEIIPKLLKYSPNTILLIETNPVEIMTYVAWKISGLPMNKVIGSGTSLDTARFKYLISKKLGIPPETCRGYIIGEHDEEQVPIWSSISFAGVKLRDLNPDAGTTKDKENWSELYTTVVNSPATILKLKGHTCWAIALSLSRIVKSMLTNSNSIQTVSTNINGIYDISYDVFMSIPCVLSSQGVYKITKLPLTKDEKRQLLKLAKNHKKLIQIIKF